MSAFQPPVAYFPPELLCEIYMCIHDAQDEIWDAYTDTSWLSVSQVNQHWRQVTLNCPAFWARIVFGKPQLAAVMVERARNSPLIIRANDHFNLVQYVCCSHFANIHDVIIQGTYDHINRLYRDIYSSSALKELTLGSTETLDFGTVIHSDFLPATPFSSPLRKLTLRGYLLPWTALRFPVLTSLHIHSIEPNAREDGICFGILHALSTMPLLEHLILEDALSPIDPTGMKKIQLPNLSYLKLVDNSESLSQAALLDLPLTTIVEVWCVDCDDVPDVPLIVTQLINRLSHCAWLILCLDDNCNLDFHMQHTQGVNHLTVHLRPTYGSRSASYGFLGIFKYLLSKCSPTEIVSMQLRGITDEQKDSGKPPLRSCCDSLQQWQSFWHDLFAFTGLRRLHLTRDIPPLLLETLICRAFGQLGFTASRRWRQDDPVLLSITEKYWHTESREILPSLTHVEFEDIDCSSSTPNATDLIFAFVWARRQRRYRISSLTFRNCTTINWHIIPLLKVLSDCHFFLHSNPPYCVWEEALDLEGLQTYCFTPFRYSLVKLGWFGWQLPEAEDG